MKLKKFKLLGGGHQDEKGRNYVKDDVVKSAQPLDRIFPGKFEPLSSQESDAEPKEDPEPSPEASKATLAAARGVDVTSQFPLAEEEGFTVTRRGSYFHVFEGDDAKPLNPKGLKKANVDPFVKAYLEE